MAKTNENAATRKSIFDDLIKHSKEGKIRNAAVAGEAGEREKGRSAPTRHRSNVVGTDSAEMAKKVEMLQAELDKANARILRRDETISELKARDSANRTNEKSAKQMEGKLQELVKKYQSSKAKHQTELATLQDTRDANEKKIEELKRAHLEAEREIWSLQQKLNEERQRGAASADEAERSLRQELRSAQQAQQAAEERAEALESRLADTTAVCALLARDRVSADDHQALQEAYYLEREESEVLRRRFAILESELVLEREDARDWEARCAAAEEARDDLAAALDSLMAQRALDFATTEPVAPDSDIVHTSLDMDEELATVADLAMTHAHLLSAHFNGQLNYMDSCISSLVTSLLSTEAGVEEARASLEALTTDHRALQSLHNTVVAQHAPCESLIGGLQVAITRAEASEGLQKAALFEARRDIEGLEDRVREAKEGVRRANEAVGRSKAAEGALIDEVNEEALASAAGYQTLYDDLRAEHELLLSREAVMLDEVERVGAQNAELLGPVNGGQKLNYIDGLRREVAMVKHELATTRHRLNTAQDRIASLTSEIEAYKSIDSPVGGSVLGGSSRTKVRRVPEGTAIPGRTLTAKRSQGLLRSASGPVR